MLRFALAVALGFAAITLSGVTNVRAEDKKKEEKKAEAKTIEGTLTCTKCALKETKQCGHAIIAKEGEKKVTYYLVDKGGKEPYHKNCCTADVDGVKVTGKVVKKEDKLTIEEPKVTLPK